MLPNRVVPEYRKSMLWPGSGWLATALSCIGLLITVIIPSSLQAQAAMPTAVAQVLNQSEPGSGFFLRLGGSVYFITARHVLGTTTKDLTLKLGNGETIMVPFADQLPLGELDSALVLIKQPPLSIFPLEADGSDPSIGSTLTVWGYPISNSTIAVPLTRREGSYLGEPQFQLDQGYSLLYAATTQVGFSGGPIINQAGNVVGMHGRSESLKNASGEQIRTGNALGIPIKNILASLGALNSGSIGSVDLKAVKALAAKKSMEIAYQMLSSDNLSNQVLDELGRAGNGEIPKHCVEGAKAYYYIYFSSLPDLSKAKQSISITTYIKGVPATYYALSALLAKKMVAFDQSVQLERIVSKAGGGELLTFSERRLKQAFLDELKSCVN